MFAQGALKLIRATDLMDSTEKQLYDAGKLHVRTVDAPAEIIGKLWVEYDIELCFPGTPVIASSADQNTVSYLSSTAPYNLTDSVFLHPGYYDSPRGGVVVPWCELVHDTYDVFKMQPGSYAFTPQLGFLYTASSYGAYLQGFYQVILAEYPSGAHLAEWYHYYTQLPGGGTNPVSSTLVAQNTALNILAEQQVYWKVRYVMQTDTAPYTVSVMQNEHAPIMMEITRIGAPEISPALQSRGKRYFYDGKVQFLSKAENLRIQSLKESEETSDKPEAPSASMPH
jgi:hypothetical protein